MKYTSVIRDEEGEKTYQNRMENPLPGENPFSHENHFLTRIQKSGRERERENNGVGGRSKKRRRRLSNRSGTVAYRKRRWAFKRDTAGR
jgi:hypothetical protein